MKRVLFVLLFFILFCACEKESKSTEHFSVDGQESIVTGQAVQESINDAVTTSVIDETGKKRRLKLDRVINLENRGVPMQKISYPFEYAQTEDGHYYYLRGDSAGYYTIYRDRGECVAVFFLPYEIEGFVKYKDNFYIIYLYDPGDEETDGDENIEDRFGRVDLKEKKVVDLAVVDSAAGCFVYQDELFRRNPLVSVIGGKLYYGEQEGKEVTLYTRDLATDKTEVFFQYERKDKRWLDINIYIDKDYIYCQDYIIPRKGGVMERVFEKAYIPKKTVFYDSRARYAVNERYIFYIDGRFRVRRIDKKTKKDIEISKIKAMGVNCTEDAVYVTGYNKYFMEWKFCFDRADYDDEYRNAWDLGWMEYANDLYYMDLDGKNRQKLWKRGGYEKAYEEDYFQSD